jgi:RNA polymerase sigma-70 factor (ECF subfamily)
MTARPEEDEAAEALLVEGLVAGDEAAYERLIREHGPRLLAVTRRILGDRQDAEDALQEAFLSAFRKIEGFDRRARLSTWLHRIAVNAALMRLRSRRRREERDLETLGPRFADDGHFLEPPAPWSESGEAQAIEAETRRTVQEAIASLPETHRNALLLRDIQGLSNEEVARELGITTNAAKIRVHRARQALQALLDPHMRGQEPE